MMVPAYAKIFPPIGIARLGDSDTEWFIGPEWPGQRLSTVSHRYKDESGRVKRQAARFRLYAFDPADEVVGEITAADAQIHWSVQLANRKAAWLPFESGPKAIEYFEMSITQGSEDLVRRAHTLQISPRNPSVGLRDGDGGQPEWDPQVRAATLEIVTPATTIDGNSRSNTSAVEVSGTFNGQAVKLGELRIDDQGRLVALGGHGISRGTGLNGADVWIRHYANNDGWFDDVSDGPVTATVITPDGEIPVRGPAWLIVAPPDFAPDTENLVTAYDAMCEAITHNGVTVPKELSLERHAQLEFWRDIYPILQRLDGYSWVSALGLRGHGYGKNGAMTGDRLAMLADPSDPAGRAARAAIGKIIRKPFRWHPTEQPSESDIELATTQANLSFMPPLSGDTGDVTTGDPSTWLTVTPTQYSLLQQWAANDFVAGTASENADETTDWENRFPIVQRPQALTRGVLERCAGGPFYPGIEITSILKSPRFYQEAFRIDPLVLRAGDVTKWMACPWQADFWECQMHWWPAQRPDDIVRVTDFADIMRRFPVEAEKGQLPGLLFPRTSWARGVGSARPSLADLEAALTGEATEAELAAYRIRNAPGPSFVQLVTGRISRIWDRGILPTPTYPTITRATDAEPLYPDQIPSPWRLQYLLQEAVDRYSGLFFFFAVPTPEKTLKPCPPRSEWKSHCRSNPGRAAEELDAYRSAVVDHLTKSVSELLDAVLRGDPTPTNLAEVLTANAPLDRDPTAGEIRRLACVELVSATVDAWYLIKSGHGGDVDMVAKWATHGFVVQKKIGPSPDAASALVETERREFDGMSWGDYFYLLQNPSSVRDYDGLCDKVVSSVLDSADELIDFIARPDQPFVEAPFPYSDDLFDAKLEEIYEIYRVAAQDPRPWEMNRTREEICQDILYLAPFNQLDGAWLRFAEDGGEVDAVHGLLFQVWRDEVGNGKPSEHHGNLYTTLLRSLGFDLPDTASRAYVEEFPFTDEAFVSPAFELAISARSKEHLPELLGMTLYLEWEVLDLSPGVSRWDYLGIDQKFLRMHVGIDNAADGHGAKAKEAVRRYLSEVAASGGDVAVQAHWKRIWRGFVAFAAPMPTYLPDEQAVRSRRPLGIEEQLAIMIEKKRPYANRNHLERRLGGNRINDLFEYPEVLLPELAASTQIVPGLPQDSRFLTYLTTYNGPMYKVFNDDELKLWTDWIVWLGREGDTSRPKMVLTRAEAMRRLLELIRSGGLASDGHARMKVGGRTLRDWFGEADVISLMKALREETSGWVVPGDASASALVVDQLRADRPMGRALDVRFAELQGRIGRRVIVDWINGGCLLPGEKAARPSAARPPGRLAPPKVLLVHTLGQGSVH